jgi:DHA1 family tetracycline resistance protein-like MFS transporter
MPETSAAPRKAAAAFILVTVFIDMLSIGVIIPVLPNLIKSFLGGSVSEAGLWTGIFGAAWGLAQFLFTPIQGGLSDAIGRRPVVLASNFGTGVDFLFMALAPGLWWLLIGRIISGMTSASISTAYA